MTAQHGRERCPGNSEFKRGEYTHALELLTPFAQRGNGHAQAMLAKIYLGQTGGPRNETLAKQWVEKSAAQNHPDGLILLSQMYLSGNAMAQFAAGALHIDGMHGIPYSATQAQEWFNKGVAQLP